MELHKKYHKKGLFGFILHYNLSIYKIPNKIVIKSRQKQRRIPLGRGGKYELYINPLCINVLDWQT